MSKIQRKLDKAFDSYGSLSFMAPEIFSDRGYNDSCDVWSFGITMHNLKYSNYPFDDSNSSVIRNKIMHDDYICEGNNYDDNIIKGCLIKNEFERFNIKDVVNKLEDISWPLLNYGLCFYFIYFLVFKKFILFYFLLVKEH